MQLRPHFLFNAFNALGGLIRSNQNERATFMLGELGELLRGSLRNVDQQEVSLRQELEFLDHYLQIQQIRFPEWLSINISIEPEVLDLRVPNLILQPLVENAIRHGIAERTSPGLLEVYARRAEGSLEIRILDNGPGLPADWQMENTVGIGLSNTQARLKHLYGSAQRFEIGNRTEGGVEILISIPNHS